MSNQASEKNAAPSPQPQVEIQPTAPTQAANQPVVGRKNQRSSFFGLNDPLKGVVLVGAMIAALISFATATIQNASIYRLDEQTIDFLSQAFNATVLLTIPLLLGAVGALTRLLLSGMKVTDHLELIAGSSLMACFSWISIKSGVLVSIIAPHLANHGVETKEALSSSNTFYTMALVAIVVGMFSTNLYLFITQRVEQLSNRATLDNKPRS